MRHLASAVAMFAFAGGALASEVASLPIREVTAFKDGHALVVRTGDAAVGADGDVVLADLPRPVLGTFWADDAEEGARLASVTVERIETVTSRAAATPRDLLRANVGRTITFRDPSGDLRTGELLEILERTEDANPPAAAAPVWNGRAWAQQPVASPRSAHRVALIQEGDSVAALPIEEIRDVRFSGGPPADAFLESEHAERMTLDLEWEDEQRAHAAVSLMYLQRGLRWIPSYRVTLLDDERVRIELQATLVNELANLDDVTLHVAIGAPEFAFAHTPDPMALRESLDQLGLFFQRATDGQTGALLSNALMAQGARMGGYGLDGTEPARGAGAPALELAGSERAEDLYVFTVRGVTLAHGARMVVPLVSYDAPAESVYRLDLPASPPVQGLRNFNNEQHRELARLLNRPSPRHVLRIRNENERGYPITTAPALVIKDGRTLAQGLISYTAPGATVDLEVGCAVDIAVDTDERETGRTPDALRFDNNNFVRVDLAFEAEVVNHKPHAVTVEVRKLAFGAPVTVSEGGEAVQRSVFGDDFAWPGERAPWWRWYSWPYYWHQLNGAAEFTWTIEIEAGASRTLEASWHYYWG